MNNNMKTKITVDEVVRRFTEAFNGGRFKEATAWWAWMTDGYVAKAITQDTFVEFGRKLAISGTYAKFAGMIADLKQTKGFKPEVRAITKSIAGGFELTDN